MLIIFGSSEKKDNKGEERHYCSVCERETQHTREDRTTRLTVYFIPVIPISTRRMLRCNLCGHEQKA